MENAEKKYVSIEGEYDGINGAHINCDISVDRRQNVLVHELVHDSLYTKSTYGQFFLMMDKNAIFSKKSLLLSECMSENMRRMQEMTAINVEILHNYTEYGEEGYLSAVEALKERNNKYYGFFRKLCCINGKVDNADKAKAISNIIINIALIALNIDLAQIPFEIIDSKEKYCQFISADHNGIKFSPNRRFEVIMNVLFRNNDNDNDIDAVYNASIDISKADDYSLIHNIAFENAKKVLLTEPNSEDLIKRIKTVGVLQYSIEESVLAVRPEPIDQKNEIYVHFYSDCEAFLNMIKDDSFPVIMVGHKISGYEYINLILSPRKELEKKKLYLCNIGDVESLLRVLPKVEKTVVFNKLNHFENDGNAIRKMVRKLPIYIYVDVQLLGMLNKIETVFRGGKFSFLKSKDQVVLVVYKKSQILISDVLEEAIAVLKRRWNNLIEYCDSIEMITNIDINEIISVNELCHDFEILNEDDIIYLQE